MSRDAPPDPGPDQPPGAQTRGHGGHGDDDDEVDALPHFPTLLKAIGTGPGRSRHLTRAEAASALGAILDGGASALQTGAFLALMRYRGENADELAGFRDAARARLAGPAGAASSGADLDWPSYASGSLGASPYALAAADLLAGVGIKVLLHGAEETPARRAALARMRATLGIPVAHGLDEARTQLQSRGVAWIDLAELSPELARLIGLRSEMGMRSPLHTVVRTLNPLDAPAQIIGVFHPPYVGLHHAAAALWAQPRHLAFKGGGGEAIRSPFKPTSLHRRDGAAEHIVDAPAWMPGRGHRLPAATADEIAAALTGGGAPEVQATIAGTAAFGLWITGRAADLAEADRHADALLRERAS